MKTYFATTVALGLLASTAVYAQQSQTQQPPSTEDQQQAGEPSGERQELSPRFLKQIQARLHQQGYYDGKVSGNWDQDTSDALQNFQEANGLQASGQLDGMTILILGLRTGGPHGQAQAMQGQAQGMQDQAQGMQGMAEEEDGGPPNERPMGQMTGQMGQGEQIGMVRAYRAGFQNGFVQGFRQSQALLAQRQSPGAGQGSSQPPQQYRGGQQQ